MSANWEFSLTDFPSDERKARDYVQLNFKSLLEKWGKHTELLTLWNIWLYLENDSPFRKQKVRTDDRQKRAFALNWVIWHLFWQSRDAGQPLLRGAYPRNGDTCFKKALNFLEETGDPGGHEISTVYRRWKKDERVFCMPKIWAAAVFNYRLLDRMNLLRKDLPLIYPDRPKSESELAEFSKEIRLIKRILKRLRCSSKLTERELYRPLTVPRSELMRVLERLEFHHVINWDRPTRTISWAWWNPRDKRKFVWLERSSWPNFGPRLEKDKVHRFSDYNSRVVEEWIRTGAATAR